MNELIDAYAWCVLQVTLFSLTACVVYLIFRRSAAQHNTAMLATSLTVVGLLTLLSLSPWPRWSWSPSLGLPTSPAPEGALPAMISATASSARVAEVPSDWLTESADNTPTRPAWPRTGMSSPLPHGASARGHWPWKSTLVVAAWLAGAVGLARLAIGLFQMRQCSRHGATIDDMALRTTIDELMRLFPRAKRVRVRETPALGVPATVGWFRPTVLLPTSWRDWSADERRAVLAHELAHVEDRHTRTWLVGQLALIAHLYHPLVHWLARRLRLEMELAADRLAVHAFDDRRQYAAALAQIALGRQPGRAWAEVGLFMTRPLLMRRIAMLRQPTEPPATSSRWSRGLALLLILTATLAAVGLRGQSAVTAADRNAATDPASESPATPPISAAPAAPAIRSDTSTTQPYVVTALFHVSRQAPSLLDTDREPMSDAAWSTFCNTQVALATSDFVLQQALGDPEIAALPLVRSQSDPVGWLGRRLVAGFVPPNSEILAVQIGSSEDEVGQLKQIVDAVVQAYAEEAIILPRQRTLSLRDALAAGLSQLNDELARKSAEAHDIALAVGSAEHGGVGQIEREIALRRLDRIETELMRLENEQFAAEVLVAQSGETTAEHKAKLQFYEQRLAQLRERQRELEETIKSLSESSVDLDTRTHELQQLQRITDQMAIKLETINIESRATPDRIRLIQSATVSNVAGAETRTAPPRQR